MNPDQVLNIIGDLCIANNLNQEQVNKVAEAMDLLFLKEEVQKQFTVINSVLDWENKS